MSEFYRCEGNVRDFGKSLGNVREKILSGKVAQKLSKKLPQTGFLVSLT